MKAIKNWLADWGVPTGLVLQAVSFLIAAFFSDSWWAWCLVGASVLFLLVSLYLGGEPVEYP